MRTTCGIEGCGEQVKARGWCTFHYDRWRTHGDPLAGGPRRAKRGSLTPEQRRLKAAAAARIRRAEKGQWRPADGLCTKCKAEPCTTTSPWGNACLAAYKRERRRDPEVGARIREVGSDSWLRRKYNLTRQEYDAMLADQGGVCALCGKPPAKNRLAVDHDHNTGQVRGLLCRGCNGALGWVDARGVDTILRYLS